ncbi:MAG: LemA family protein [Ferruginibacter sp.]
MKLGTTILLVILLSFQKSYGQDTTVLINTAWTNLKTQLQRRTDIISNLTSILSTSTKIDKEQLNNCKVFSIDLFKYVDTLSFKDSLSISLASGKNHRLTQALAKTLATLENDKRLRSDNQLQGLIMQLEGCENRIALAKREYNETCKEYNKTDLLFGHDKMGKASETKF